MNEMTVNTTGAVKYEQEIPGVLKAMQAVQKELGAAGLDATLAHLVHIRASQINGCAHCIKMHFKEARQHGETNDRLDRLVVWRHVHDFTDREKAALAWTEALTSLHQETELGPFRARLREHFNEKEIAALTSEIAMINMWNRVAISRH
jgi:AhpD family alkylhydroperoxidase